MPVPVSRKPPSAGIYYAYVWRLDGVVIWVGFGHNRRGVPGPSNYTGRPESMRSLIRSRWQDIKPRYYKCKDREQAISEESRLTVQLKPKFNTVVGFAGFTGKRHTEATKSALAKSSTGRPASELCKRKSSERMKERNVNAPPRLGKTNSPEHRRKISEAMKRRHNNASDV